MILNCVLFKEIKEKYYNEYYNKTEDYYNLEEDNYYKELIGENDENNIGHEDEKFWDILSTLYIPMDLEMSLHHCSKDIIEKHYNKIEEYLFALMQFVHNSEPHSVDCDKNFRVISCDLFLQLLFDITTFINSTVTIENLNYFVLLFCKKHHISKKWQKQFKNFLK